MKTFTEAQLRDACYEADLDPEYALRTDYSGRGMYGDHCIGIVHDEPDAPARFMSALATIVFLDREYHGGWDEKYFPGQVMEDFNNFLRGLPDSSRDNMGLSMITYWPRIVLAEEEETSDATA